MGKLSTCLSLIAVAAITTPRCLAVETLDTAPIISALIDAANDADGQVRYSAFNALKTQPRSDELLELFWQGLEDSSGSIRILSLDRVVAFEGPSEKVLRRLVLLAGETKIPTTDALAMHRQVESHLVSIGTPAIPYLVEALKSGKATRVVVSALGKIPLGEQCATVATQLSSLLKSDDKAVRLAAVKSLHSIMITVAKAKAEAKALAEAKEKDVAPRYMAYYTKLLHKYDSNMDGSLTKNEWSKMSKDPANADTNQDGSITVGELAKWSMTRR